MAVTNDTVLVEILTSANLSGIESAGAGLAGFNKSLMGGTLVMGGLVLAGKSMIDISREHTKVEKDLETAINDRNAAASGAGTVDPATQKELARVNKEVASATKAHEDAAYHLALLQGSVFRKGHKETTDDALRLAHAQKQLTTTTDELATAHAAQAHAQTAVRTTIKNTTVDSAALKLMITDFIQTNRDYISNTDDVTGAYVSLVREGVPVKDLNRDMNAILDIAAAENISVADATNLLQGAEAGRNVGLKKAVGLTLEAIPATATFAEKQEIVSRNIDKVGKAYDGARQNMDPLQVAQDHLSQSWSQMAIKDGPALIGTLTDLVNYVNDHAIPAFGQLDYWISQLGGGPGGPGLGVQAGLNTRQWLDDQVAAANRWLTEHHLQPGQAGPPSETQAPYMLTPQQLANSLSGAGHDRPTTVNNTNNVTVNVAGTSATPQQIASAVSRQITHGALP